MATKSLSSMASLSEEIQDFSNENNEIKLLTNDPKAKDPFEANEGRKTKDDEVVMVGVRMTKRHRKLVKSLAVQQDITIQELVRRALSAYRNSQGLR
jgi:hypothetical protein